MNKISATGHGYWRDAFGSGETIQRVRPRENFAYLRNPHRGTATFQRFNGDPTTTTSDWDDRNGPVAFTPCLVPPESLLNAQYPRTTLSYCRWIWSDIEPGKGRIRWEIFDGALRAARERGQTLQVRLQPFIGNDMPVWYWTAGGTAAPDSAGAGPLHPDHNNPAYLRHWGDLIRAFGERYDGHPDLESFDIAYGGPCGETGGNCTPDTEEALTGIYLESFLKTQLIAMLGTHGCTVTARLKDRRIGWRADCYGDLRNDGKGVVPDALCWNHMYDAYPQQVVENGVTHTWKQAPVILETCWTVPYWYRKGWDLDWILEQGYAYHMSVFMPKSAYIPDEIREKIDAFDRRLGYRFALRQLKLPLECRRGQTFRAEVFMENVGVAPIYRPYTLALRFRQGVRTAVAPFRADIRDWLPGHTWFAETLTLPASLEPGEVQVDIGVVDPVAMVPRVLLAIDPVSPDGWHPLTRMDVKDAG